jgi:TRAP-type C4-dicarboxylate transport system permease small subunit
MSDSGTDTAGGDALPAEADPNLKLPGWRWIDRALGLVVAVILFFMMMVTVIDVIMREALPGAFPAADELTRMSLAILVFAALPLVSARSEHVSITLLDPLFRGRSFFLKGGVVALVCAAIVGLLGWRMALLALGFAENGDYLVFTGVRIAPFAWVMVVMCAWTVLLLIALAIRDITTSPQSDRPA